jgi:hypothetical protein
MLYLKHTLGGLGRTLTDSVRHSFQGRYRWWKLALYTAVFMLPGGSLAVLFFAWVDQRRGQDVPAASDPATRVAQRPGAIQAEAMTPAPACPATRSNAPACRAAARKVTRQAADARFSPEKSAVPDRTTAA